MNERRLFLIKKLQSKTEHLTREESNELGPVTSRELAPETGDSFMDEMVRRERLKRLQTKIRTVLSRAYA